MKKSLPRYQTILLCSLVFASTTFITFYASTAGWRPAEAATDIACNSTTVSGGPDINAVNAPQPYRVFQRDQLGVGKIVVSLSVSGPADCVEVQVMSGSQIVVPWKGIAQGVFATWGGVLGTISVPQGGWYQLQVRAVRAGVAGTPQIINNIGVGDVFVTAGQSNSTFWGGTPQTSATGRVSYFDGTSWSVCRDPLPSVDGGTSGAPWCLLGDKLVQAYDVPVAFAPTGWGGTKIGDWQPNSVVRANSSFQPPQTPGSLYYRLLDRVNYFGPGGIKAILWHQGEYDALLGTAAETYRSLLLTLIQNIRNQSGFVVPWFISRASYVNPSLPYGPTAPVGIAQRAVVDNSTIFTGPDTDLLVDNLYRGSATHFNNAGLAAHAQQWFQQLNAVFNPNYPKAPTCTLVVPAGAVPGNLYTVSWTSTGATYMTSVVNPAVQMSASGNFSTTTTSSATTTFSTVFSGPGTYSYMFTGPGGNAWCRAQVLTTPAYVDRGVFNGAKQLLFQSANGTVHTWNTDAKFTAVPLTGPANPGAATWKLMQVADMSNDGNDDFVWQYPNGTVNIWYLSGVTYVGFKTIPSTGTAANGTWKVIDVLDIDGDTYKDLVWSMPNGSTTVWYLAKNNELKTEETLSGVTAKYVGWGTFSGTKNLVFQASNGTVYTWNPGTKFAAVPLTGPANPGAASWKLMAIADMNNNGNDDFVWQYPNGTVNLWYLNGVNYAGFRTMANTGTAANNSWKVVDALDIDGDNYKDLVWRMPEGLITVWYLTQTNDYKSARTYSP